MADTHRNIRGIDKAGQKDLWERKNPGNVVQAPAAKTTGDSRPNKSNGGNKLPATKSLTDK